jgi:hypothetical protein
VKEKVLTGAAYEDVYMPTFLCFLSPRPDALDLPSQAKGVGAMQVARMSRGGDHMGFGGSLIEPTNNDAVDLENVLRPAARMHQFQYLPGSTARQRRHSWSLLRVPGLRAPAVLYGRAWTREIFSMPVKTPLKGSKAPCNFNMNAPVYVVPFSPSRRSRI